MIDFNALVAQRVAAKSALAAAKAAREEAEVLWTTATGAVSVPAPAGRANGPRRPVPSMGNKKRVAPLPSVVGHGDLNVIGQKYGNACRAEANAKAAYLATVKVHNDAMTAAGA